MMTKYMSGSLPLMTPLPSPIDESNNIFTFTLYIVYET